MNIPQLRCHLTKFQFQKLFVEDLGWDNPIDPASGRIEMSPAAASYSKIAEIGGVPVLKFDRTAFDRFFKGNSKKFHQAVKKHYNKHLLLFSDEERFFTLSYLSKEGQVRSHDWFKGQSGDYFISKLTAVHFGIEDEPKIAKIVENLENAFDTEKVTKRFFEDFKSNHSHFLNYISGIENSEERKWFASLILNRLMFIWFLQKKGFINGDFDYLQNKLKESKQKGKDRYYQEFLTCLFFEGFAKKPIERSPKAKTLLGKIKYLNGGLFVPHAIEEKYEIQSSSAEYKTAIKINDKAFEETFKIFGQYDWCLQGKEGKSDNEISPDVMGYIFEKYINELQQKSLGAYYTRDEITQYLSRSAIQKSVLEKVNKKGYTFQNMAELLHQLDASLCKRLLTDEDSILNTLTVLDPAVGSGAFLTAAIKELVNIYSPIIGKIEILGDRELKRWLESFKDKHKSLAYGIKKNIILKNLYGVDIMKEAVEVCKLRLFLSLVSSALSQEELEPLPNMDFNILCGNSLIGFLREGEANNLSSEKEAKKNTNPEQMKWSEVLGKDYNQIKAEYNRLVSRYKNQPLSFAKLKDLKNKTSRFLKENSRSLSRVLADKCNREDVQYPEILDIKGKKKTIKKRAVGPEDFYSENAGRNLNPFHWDFAFNEIMARGGFDVIITNPPWEKIKIEDREFFYTFDTLIDKKRTAKAVVKKKKEQLLQDPKILKDYKNTKEFYLFQREYFSKLYQYQTGAITNSDGSTREASADMDTYRIFLERSFEILDKNGALSIVLPSGLCKDDGAIGLRKNLLFKKTKIECLIDFQNQMEKGKGRIFEGVHQQFKFLLLNLQKYPSKDNKFPCLFHARDLTVLAEGCFPVKQKAESKQTLPDNNHSFLRKLSKSPRKSNKLSSKESQDPNNKTDKQKNITEQTASAKSQTVWLSNKEVKELSPRDCSIIEFKSPKDMKLLKKAKSFPALYEKIKDSWNPVFYREFDETNDSHLFENKKLSGGYLPLYKGEAIYQYEFNHDLSHINRFVNLKSQKIQGQGFPFKNKCYKNYRLVIRTIASNTNERSLISAVIPKNHFCANSLYGVHINFPEEASLEDSLENNKTEKKTGQRELLLGAKESYSLKPSDMLSAAGLKYSKTPNPSKAPLSRNKYMLLLQAFFNSFVVDYFIRQKVSANINKKFITPLHIPRLTEKDDYFKELVERSAKLTCIGREFDALADEIGVSRGGVTDQKKRWKIQGEIDAIAAYIYKLTLEEFEYILSTFTTGNNQKRLNALKKYALEAFKKNKLLDKAS